MSTLWKGCDYIKYYISALHPLKGFMEIIQENKPLYILETFFNGKQECDFKKNLAAKEFMLDSGAFTFMNSKSNVKAEQIEEYLHNYCKYIKQSNISNFIEMDLDCIFGYEQVKSWRKQIEKETNKQVIPVWHKSRGIEDYKKTLKEYNYIAIGGFAIKEIKQKEFDNIRKMVRFAFLNGKKIHALGYSRKDILTYNFYSVDSASWKIQAALGGMLYKFSDNTIKIINVKKDGYKTDIKKLKCCNLKEIIKYQYYLDTK